MKSLNHYIRLVFLSGALLFAFSCNVDEVLDPNNPSLESVSQDATRVDLQLLVYGLEAYHRDYFTNATQMFGSFGREVWAYFGSDPRFINDWLGIGLTETYNDFFASAGTYNSPYQTINQADELIKATLGSSVLTDAEASGYTGFAKTIKAYQYIWPLMQQFDNGIRFEVDDRLNPGPFLDYNAALQKIRELLDAGNQDLQKAGSSFDFVLTSGFSGFDTPAGMIKLNRAVAARLALYAEDWQGALNVLPESFFDLDVTAATSGKMNIGPAHVYGEAPDINNPLFYPYDRPTNTILIAHPALVEDALPGDQRIATKLIERVDNLVSNSRLRDANGDPLLGVYQDNRWLTNTSSIPFLRNEELILIYAEAQARLNQADLAVDAINVIRNTWGLADYAGATDTESLIDEILFQRRYSLWAEGGHRWIDLRRTGRLNDQYIDLRDRGNIFTSVARRTSEINWDEQ